MTEKLLFLGKAIQIAGTVKARKSSRHATSDWMKLEQQRGISVTTSVMQFFYQNNIMNLLDTPGHEDFSEDTYRTLTAVDSALMVIDGAKGVEKRTIKLMEICRLRDTPIITFVNKWDRESLTPLEIIDNIESTLNIECVPITWPIGMGKTFKALYHFANNQTLLHPNLKQQTNTLSGLEHHILQPELDDVREELQLIADASPKFSLEKFLNGQQTPVFFGSALSNFGVETMLQAFVDWAPPPQPRQTTADQIKPSDSQFSGFVFKIQANMDPQHRDRIAFFKICSGQYQPGMKVHNVRKGKDMQLNNALTFFAGDRKQVQQATAGDIIGISNHGTLQIGDTLTTKGKFKVLGIPEFAPELFRCVQLQDPLKSKALLKGLQQLCEEGATQLFRPIMGNELILGAIGPLQFDVVAFRLQQEYQVKCSYRNINCATVRWIQSDDDKIIANLKKDYDQQLALDNHGDLVFMARSLVNLQLIQQKYPQINFNSTREIT